MKKVVIALGGNALQARGEAATSENQLRNVMATAEHIARIIGEGYEVIISHGNGPQVGRLMLQNEAGKSVTPPMPMDVCGAMTQGMIGYHIQQGLSQVLRENGIDKPVCTVVTQVEVDGADPAFRNPTKPVGAFYTEEEAMRIQAEKGCVMKKDANRGFRRVVPSPMAQKIIEIDTIKTLVDSGTVVVAAGGGGIPGGGEAAAGPGPGPSAAQNRRHAQGQTVVDAQPGREMAADLLAANDAGSELAYDLLMIHDASQRSCRRQEARDLPISGEAAPIPSATQEADDAGDVLLIAGQRPGPGAQAGLSPCRQGETALAHGAAGPLLAAHEAVVLHLFQKTVYPGLIRRAVAQGVEVPEPLQELVAVLRAIGQEAQQQGQDETGQVATAARAAVKKGIFLHEHNIRVSLL